MKLRTYYKNYFNDDYFRFVRYVKDTTVSSKGVESKYDTDVLNYPLVSDPSKWTPEKLFLNFLLRHYKLGTGSLLAGLTHFKNISDYRTNDVNSLLAGKLFFDFDVDDPRTKDLKHKILDVKRDPDITGKSRLDFIKQCQDDFKRLILEEDLLKSPFGEVMKLKSYLLENDISPYIVFSGSKGFHVNIFFKDLVLNDLTNLNRSFANIFKRKLGLNLLDFNIYGNSLTAVQRVPYGVHERTGLYTTPVDPEISYDELLDLISKNRLKVHDFNMSDYYVNEEFRRTLKEVDKENMIKKEANDLKQEEVNRLKKKYSPSHYGKNGGNKSLIFEDMRELLKVVVGEPVREYEHYNSYICPFHDDHKPSALVSRYKFKCKSCNLNLNYFEFLRKYYDLESDDEVKQKMKELKNK